MSQPIRAVYKGGQLWLLDSVHVSEGQEIRVLILSKEDPGTCGPGRSRCARIRSR
jgi:predicted DNA-binding antitoxin AbrB/MazE fold protein